MKLQRMTFPHPPPPHLRSFAWLTMTGYDMIKCSSGFKGGGGLNGRQAVHPPPPPPSGIRPPADPLASIYTMRCLYLYAVFGLF